MTDEPKKETGLLRSIGSQPMKDRMARPNTTILGTGSRLQVKIGEAAVMMNISDNMLIGRSIDGEDASTYALDLTPYEAYQNGISRQHAIITQHDGGLYIEDLGSTNGTRINGFQLTARRKYRLRDGDEVEFARLRTVLKFVQDGQSE